MAAEGSSDGKQLQGSCGDSGLVRWFQLSYYASCVPDGQCTPFVLFAFLMSHASFNGEGGSMDRRAPFPGSLAALLPRLAAKMSARNYNPFQELQHKKLQPNNGIRTTQGQPGELNSSTGWTDGGLSGR